MFRSLALGSSFLGVLACATPPAGSAPALQVAAETPADAYAELVAADHWRDRNAARDRLAAFGADALPTVLVGCGAEPVEVRRACFEVLWNGFAGEPAAVERVIAGLEDPDDGFIAYGCAFHLGEHGIEEGAAALRGVLASEAAGVRTRAASLKSLGELGHGDADVVIGLWTGLGSEDAYTRYLSNLGVRGLMGRDLTAFDYGSPWEGAFVSGPAVAVAQGMPIEKAERRAARWAAVAAFTRWMRDERPELFSVLESNLW